MEIGSSKIIPSKINLAVKPIVDTAKEQLPKTACISGLVAGMLGVYDVLINNHNISANIEIQEKLSKIERENNIKIIYACEVGSRAWGNDSKDSDYDIRYIYVSPKSHYLNEPAKDNLKNELNEKYDIYGYDVSKIITLFKEQKYNSFEWLNSPVVYRTTKFSEELKEIINSNFNLEALAASYVNLAKLNYTKLIKNKDNVDIKAYLLVLKSILTAEYINEYHKLPPLKYQNLFETQLDKNLEETKLIMDLLSTKKINTKNIKPIAHIKAIDDFIENKLTVLGCTKKVINPMLNEPIVNDYLERVINDSHFADINKIRLTPTEQSRLDKYSSDITYRQAILSSLGMNSDNHLLLKSIVGPNEFSDILKNNTNKEESFSTGQNIDSKTNKIIFENVVNTKYRNNFHIHTNYSDGKMSVQMLLDSAAKYADKVARQTNGNGEVLFEPFTIAITDHNTVDGCKEAVQIIMNNPDRYKNLRIVLGTELGAKETVFDHYQESKPIVVHILVQCINPYNNVFENSITKSGNQEKKSYIELGSIEDVVNTASLEKNSVLGYAHPFAHISDKMLYSEQIYENLIRKFAHLTLDKQAYVETFYQSYGEKTNGNIKLKENLKKLANELNLYNAGGLDNHGVSLYTR